MSLLDTVRFLFTGHAQWYAPGSDYGFSKLVKDPRAPNEDAILRANAESDKEVKVEKTLEIKLLRYFPRHHQQKYYLERIERIRDYLKNIKRKDKEGNDKEELSFLESVGLGLYVDFVC